MYPVEQDAPARGRPAAAPRRWLVPGLLALACLAFALGGDGAREAARYDREAVLAWELWRLVSAHFVHLGWAHLWMNLAALAVLVLLFDPLLDAADWSGATAASIVLIDAGLLLGHGAIGWYVGLSGVLHGLLVAGALALIAARSHLGWAVLGVTAAKLAYEQWLGPLPLSEGTAGGRVIVAAHLYGAAGGAAWFAASRLVRRARRARL